jgi:ParB-like nuclease family protein
MQGSKPLQDDGNDNSLNDRLAEVARAIYGERVTLRVIDPASIRLLKRNARYLKKGTFDQLTANVREDGMLSSVPLCHTLVGGTLECVSGNHRVQAAVKAGLSRILVLVIPHELPKSQRISRQLSHNALSGQDDMTILAELWRDLESLEERLYAGLDSELVGELAKIAFQGFGAEPIRTEQMTLWFLPEEVEDVRALLEASERVAASGAVYLAPLARYEALWKALVKTKRVMGIKNTAVAFIVLIDRLRECAESIGDAPPNQGGRGSFDSTSALHMKKEGEAG